MFNELYTTVKNRYGAGSSTLNMSEWITQNTTIKKRPFTYEHYQFQKAIADDMHPDLSCKKCSQVGLALALDTPIATTTGWTTMGEIKVGDTIFDERGQPTKVTYTSPVWLDRACYEVTFDTGETIIADGQHRWYVESTKSFNTEGLWNTVGAPPRNAGFGKSGVLTTEVIAKNIKHDGRFVYRIPNAKPLSFPASPLPVDPYLVGLWLGDGTLNDCKITASVADVPFYAAELERRGYEIHQATPVDQTTYFRIYPLDYKQRGSGYENPTSSALRDLGLLKNEKFIPELYFFSSAEQRLDLLRGLMDSDGCIDQRGQSIFSNTNKRLAYDTLRLIRSLGLKAQMKVLKNPPRELGGRVIQPLDTYRISFTSHAEIPPVLLPRKRERLREGCVKKNIKITSRRIVAVTPVDTVPTRCIQVDSPNHLFLAGSGLIPTHNTEIQIRKYLAMLTRNNGVSGIFTLPTQAMFTRIYNARIKPIIDADEIFNPPTATTPIRNRNMIQIRDSFGYVTGCTEGDATSISADFLMHDELDLSPQDMIALYQSRLQNSDFKITQKFSTPTFVGFGIDKSYGVSDQREYVIKCSACNHYQIPRFTPEFVFIEKFPYDIANFHELTPDQIAGLDLENSYVRCEHCSRRLELGNPDLREWVATFPGRTNFRGYQVRPFSTSRLPPIYIFKQLAKYLDDGFIRGFYNTVLGESYADASAQIQRKDIEACMDSPNLPNISKDQPVFMGVDVGFTCHITLSYDTDAGIPHFILFETVPISQLETRIAELRKIYTIVQGCIDRFPYTTTADALRETTNSLIMPAQYRGTAAVVAVKDELGIITHYSCNNTMLFDRLHSAINNHKMVISGYTHHRETLIAQLTDMVRDEQPDSESVWKKNSGNDHFFHSMAFNLLARRICEHMFHTGSTSTAVCGSFEGADWLKAGASLMPGAGVKRLSRLGA